MLHRIAAIGEAEQDQFVGRAHLEAALRRALALLKEPDGHRVAIEFPVARLDGGDDDEDGVQPPKDRQETKPTRIRQKTAALPAVYRQLTEGNLCALMRYHPEIQGETLQIQNG
jgi:hypothetical protein